MTVDEGGNRRGDIQVGIVVEIGHDIGQVLVRFKSGDLQDPLPVAIDR